MRNLLIILLAVLSAINVNGQDWKVPNIGWEVVSSADEKTLMATCIGRGSQDSIYKHPIITFTIEGDSYVLGVVNAGHWIQWEPINFKIRVDNNEFFSNSFYIQSKGNWVFITSSVSNNKMRNLLEQIAKGNVLTMYFNQEGSPPTHIQFSLSNSEESILKVLNQEILNRK